MESRCYRSLAPATRRRHDARLFRQLAFLCIACRLFNPEPGKQPVDDAVPGFYLLEFASRRAVFDWKIVSTTKNQSIRQVRVLFACVVRSRDCDTAETSPLLCVRDKCALGTHTSASLPGRTLVSALCRSSFIRWDAVIST